MLGSRDTAGSDTAPVPDAGAGAGASDGIVGVPQRPVGMPVKGNPSTLRSI